ncbi:DUF7312 domain-containing protein [Haloferacaceae archaeon DSL9]
MGARSPDADRPEETDADTSADGDEQWRFSVDEVGPDGAAGDDEPPRPTIEPESVSLEHATFVVIGVLGTLLVLATAI